jgi:MtN3 and saliva related transmembrane protein
MFTTCIEVLFSISLIVNAAFFVPQIIKLYKTKNTSGISLLMFLGFNLIQFISILYGYIKKDYILMWGFALSLLTCGSVSILILIYRKNTNAKK